MTLKISPSTVYWRTLPLIALGWVAVYVVQTNYSFNTTPSRLIMSFVIGTTFLFPVLAATWAAFGPGQLSLRIPLSGLWAALTGVALCLSDFSVNPQVFWSTVSICCLIWMAAQVPLWSIWLFAGLRLRFQAEAASATTMPERQFGIRHWLLFTAIAGAYLGIARALTTINLPMFTDSNPIAIEKMLGLMVVLTAQIVGILPLLLACFLPRRVWLSVACSLLFVPLVASLLSPIVLRLLGRVPLLEINCVSAVWVLLFAALVRSAGYHFGLPKGGSAEIASINTDVE